MPESHIIVRVEPFLKDLVVEVATARGERRPSDFVRRAVKTELAKLSYLTAKEKKALGVRPLHASQDRVPTQADGGE